MHPIYLLKQWVDEEKAKGAIYAEHAILSTTSMAKEAHGRVVSIREIEEQGIVFFTQKRTRKVEEIKEYPVVALTFWFERMAREVIVEGEAMFLSLVENETYWQQYPKKAQLRFSSYAPTSGLPIENKDVLENKRLKLEHDYQHKQLPLSPDYCGVLAKPKRFIFYTYRLDELSDVYLYQLEKGVFFRRRLSP